MSGWETLSWFKLFLSDKCCLRRLLTRVENKALVSCRCDPIQTAWMMRVREGQMKEKRGERKCLILKQTQYHCQICLISEKKGQKLSLWFFPSLKVLICPFRFYCTCYRCLQDTNMNPLGVNKVQRCTFLRDTAPVTTFVPFFSVNVHGTLLRTKIRLDLVYTQVSLK